MKNELLMKNGWVNGLGVIEIPDVEIDRNSINFETHTIAIVHNGPGIYVVLKKSDNKKCVGWIKR